MRCDNCGSQVDENDVYCGNCGHRIERETEVIDHTRDTDEFIDVTPANEESVNDYRNTESQPFEQSGASTEQRTASSASAGRAGNGSTPPPVYKAKLNNSSAIASLICGILSLLGVATLITAIIGLVSSKKAMQLVAMGDYDGESYAKAGKICSIIGIVFGVLQVLWIIFYVFVMVAAMFAE